uniref:Transglutaminase-like domain-containing protein n=1 Tax=Sparus aurata TaxID=8175 RepID=A0A671WSF6_SPAAU
MEEDFPEFEPFEDEVQPRGFIPQVDMCQQQNKPNHYTTAYDTGNLVVRRGQEFVVRVTFSRPLADGDDFQLEFLIGSNPSASKGSLVVVTFNSRHSGPWMGQILEMQGESVLLGITPTPDAIVGKFRTYVAISAGSGMQRTKRDTSTDLYLLFNAWCPTDAVFLPDGAERSEYVLNDIGVINQGSVGAVSSRNWMYGQFERGVLDACIHILDASRMPIFNRGNIIQLIRKGSAMINSQDDNGVLVGNWSDDYSMGKPPTSWTGSVQILLQYANTGVPVCFAQCWVFAGVFNTFLRCLGIPSRVITNFNSAHDNTGNLKTELIFKADGTPDRRNTRDSIWNYHCWNEVFTVRPDLPNGLGGWQVVDSTPQETSDGHFRCGPAPVAAIKEGLLCHPFDCGFVFAEVNSDVVYQKRDRYGTLTPYRVDKTYVGQCIYTKAVGSSATHDITHTYKYPEGNTHTHTHRGWRMRPNRTRRTLQNIRETVQANLAGSVVFYTGVIATHFKDQPFSVTVPANQKESVMLTVTAQEYMPHLGAQLCLHFVVTGQADDQSLIASKVVDLQTPGLQMQVSGSPQVKQEMVVTVTFTNPFSFPLQDVYVAMEGPGLMNQRVIESQASISWSETFLPRLPGPRRLVAVLNCRNLHQVTATASSLHFTI